MHMDVKNNKSELMDIATHDVISVSPRKTIIGAVETMTKKGFRRLPVTDPGTHKIIGIVTAGDIINFMGGGEKFNLVSKKHNGNMISALNDSVREIMSTKAVTIRDNNKISEVIDTIVNKKCGGLPITSEEGILRGIVTERDILKVLCKNPNYLSVSDIMTKSPHVTSPDARICDVTKQMISNKFRRLPVVSDDVLFGIVTAMDIMNYLGDGDVFREMTTGDVSDVMSVPVRKLISGELYTTTPDESISRVAKEMIEKGVGAFPVINNSNLVGVVTEFDLVKALSKEQSQ
ncbi:CBS domain-containing protein [Methanoplanus sp. FWC-SCC4]|uniref:CBS domain-containing protein n=2 Tax=Methanochimaera problematica TaxID=2609417 RepID=A0AA97FDA9_9EURY|nr:CBS domain-containing protein [Methanoplanus sp. FWC-SCC4]